METCSSDPRCYAGMTSANTARSSKDDGSLDPASRNQAAVPSRPRPHSASSEHLTHRGRFISAAARESTAFHERLAQGTMFSAQAPTTASSLTLNESRR